MASTNTTERVTQMFQTIDVMDAASFVTFLTEDARFTFGNAEPVSGRAAIQDAVAGFFGSINGLQHQITGLWEQDATVICKLEIDYTRKDGTRVHLPCANIFHMDGDLVRDYLIYMDINPVYV